MKIFVICSLLLWSPMSFGLLDSKVNEILVKYRNDCSQESGVSVSNVTDIYARIPDNGHYDTFAVCMLKKFNVLHKDGSVNQNVRSYKIASDNGFFYDICSRCKTHTGRTIEETARKIMNCFLNEGELLLPILPRRKNV